MSEEDAYARPPALRPASKSNGSARTTSTSSSFTSALSRIGLIALAAAVVMFIVSIVLITKESDSSVGALIRTNEGNCTILTCPPGAAGPSGSTGSIGPPGPPGPNGAKGDKGDQGDPGLPGPDGPMGQCLNDNPSCMQGPPGPPGAMGATGLNGTIGLTGSPGPPGIQGPPGSVGPAGPQGLKGDTGDDGIQGVPGACDCNALGSATFATLNVTNTLAVPVGATLTLNGTMTCPGGALAPSCFGLSVCPDFSTCAIVATSFETAATGSGKKVKFTESSFVMTAPSPFTSSAVFGRSDVVNERLGLFRAYASDVWVDGVASAQFRALAGSVTISAAGPSGNVAMSGPNGVVSSTGETVTLFATLGSVDIQAGSATLNLAFDGTMSGSAINTTLICANIDFHDTVGNGWFRTDATQSYVCPPSSGAMVANTSRTSVNVDVDLVLGPTARLVSRSADGLVQTQGLRLLCNTKIVTELGGALQLQENDTDVIDVRGTISNAIGPVVFNSPNGVDFRDTSLNNSVGTNPLHVSDAEGLSVDNGAGPSTSALWVNAINSVVPGTDPLTITAFGINLVGDVVVTGDISASGTCCTSDARVKTNVHEVAPADDLHAVLYGLPRRVSYTFTDDYLATDRHAPNGTQHGFIAQELAQSEAGKALVRTRKAHYKLSSGEVLDDFLGVSLDRAVPMLVGAIRALAQELDELRRTCGK